MVQNELDDDMRLQIARVLRAKIEKGVKSANQKKKSIIVYHKRMLDEQEGLKLLRIANKILNDNCIPMGLDIAD